MMSSDSRIVWTLFILLQLVNNANSPGPHVRDAHPAETPRDGYMRTPTVRVDPATPPLKYSRDQLLFVPPSDLGAVKHQTARHRVSSTQGPHPPSRATETECDPYHRQQQV